MKLQIIAMVHGKTYVSSATEAFDSIEDCQKVLLEVPELVMELDEEDSGLSEGATLVLRPEAFQHTHFIINKV